MKLAAFIVNLVFTCIGALSSFISLISNIINYIYLSNVGASEGIYIGSITGYILPSIISMIFCLGVGILFTIFSYQIYKGTRKNSLAIAICDLLFCGLISGILLLIDYGTNNPVDYSKVNDKSNDKTSDNEKVEQEVINK